MKVGKNIPWLVKSGGRVLGPFFDKEVIEKLLSREIVVIDEVSRPCGRWTYIRDEPAFAKAVEDIRNRNVNVSDDTTKANSTSGNFTQTLSLTDPGGDQADDLTEEITSATVQEALYQSFDDINRGGTDRRDPPPPPSAESYAFEGDRMIQAKAEASTRWLWSVTIVVLFLTVGYVIFNQFVAKPIQTRNLADESVILGLRAMEDGEYNKALEHLRTAHTANPTDKSIFLPLGVLEIQVAGQTVQGKRLLDGARGWAGADQKRVLVGLGLAALKDHDYGTAEKQFNAALQVDTLFSPALINLGISGIYEGEYQRANSNLQLALKDGSRDGADLLALVHTLFELYKSDKDAVNQNDPTYLRDAMSYMNRSIDSTSYFTEISAGMMFALKQQGKKQEIYPVIDRMLNQVLNESALYKRDLFIHRDLITWDKIGQWCLKATQDLDPTSHVVAAEAVCIYRAGDMVNSSRKIDDALAQTPRDPLVQAVYAYLLMKMNSMDKARVAAEKALDFDPQGKNTVTRALEATLCQQTRDYTCAKKYWAEVLSREPISLQAMMGMAESLYGEGQYDQSRQYLSRVLARNSNYIPGIKLKRQLEQVESKREF